MKGEVVDILFFLLILAQFSCIAIKSNLIAMAGDSNANRINKIDLTENSISDEH